jgi:isopenicillin N synthase-like dioxygenase
VIDISARREDAAREIGEACRKYGFFYVVGHGVSDELQERLERFSREFFALPVEEKLEIRMSRGGRAWRGYFPLGDELTSGRPDLKEGIYLGTELPAGHPAPLHGPNLFPDRPAELRPAVLEYLGAMTALGHRLMALIALSLGLPDSYFFDRYTADPLILFRIFNYPLAAAAPDSWGVGEHTDYGLLTILKQDGNGGLQVKSPAGWLDAVPIPGSFVCNIGDMLDRLTGGEYRSTPHRVIPSARADRMSWPFFFDPNFEAEIESVGRYGDYVLAKVGKVFPELHRDVI